MQSFGCNVIDLLAGNSVVCIRIIQKCRLPDTCEYARTCLVWASDGQSFQTGFHSLFLQHAIFLRILLPSFSSWVGRPEVRYKMQSVAKTFRRTAAHYFITARLIRPVI